MARSRRKQQSGGEGKAPLVVALAFFVIATIAAGVMAYTYSEDIAGAKQKEEDAKKEAAESAGQLKGLNERLYLYKVFAGTATADELKTVRDSANKETLQKEHEAIVKKILEVSDTSIKAEAANFPTIKVDIKPTDFFDWPWPKDGKIEKPKEPLTAMYAKMIYEREFGSSIAATQITLGLQSIDKGDKEFAEYKKDREVFPSQVTALGKKFDADVAKLRQDVEDRKKEYLAAMDAYNKARANANNEIEPLKSSNELLRIELTQAREELRELKRRTGPSRTLQFDNPSGTITATFPKTRIVEIDLGSADQVKTGLTFTVYSPEAKDRGSENKPPKAMIEVVEVVSANLSRCRITHFEDETRKPLTKGDLLYNIAWKRGVGDHVVLFGIFDTDADGTDDIKNLARDLIQMGINVDGYFDLASRKWIGAPPSYRTDYAIVGYLPTITPGDSLQGAKGELITSINNAEAQAKAKDIKIMRAREFLDGIGYKIRTDITNEQINQAASKYLILNAPVPEK